MRSFVSVAPAVVCLGLSCMGIAPGAFARQANHGNRNPNLRHSIWVDKQHQRVYAFEGEKLVLDAKCSSAANKKKWVPGDHKYEMTGTPTGNFRITRKDSDHYSKSYRVHMLWALFFAGGRAIHGTYPAEYRNLGRPASAGCVRITRGRAESLYRWANIGDPIHVVHTLPKAWSAHVHKAHSGVTLLHQHRPGHH